MPWSLDYQPDLAADALPRVDIAQSTLTGAPPPSMVRANQERRTWSAVVSWLPRWRGEHQLRGGVQFQHAPYGQNFDSLGHGDLVARYRNGVPDSVTRLQHAGARPASIRSSSALFVQDSWTIASRLTINAGVRYERHIGSLNAQSAAGGAVRRRAHLSRRSRGLVIWNNVVPRLSRRLRRHRQRPHGASRRSVSQYTQRQGAQLVDQFNPLRQNTEVRTWIDANRDLVPQLGRDRSGPGRARSRRHRAHRRRT